MVSSEGGGRAVPWGRAGRHRTRHATLATNFHTLIQSSMDTPSPSCYNLLMHQTTRGALQVLALYTALSVIGIGFLYALTRAIW